MPGKKVPSTCKKPLLRKDESPVAPRKKYKQWSEESMLGAMKAVKEGSMGLNRAALEYGVPKTTLTGCLSERVIHGCKSGRSSYLTPEEERELYDWLID